MAQYKKNLGLAKMSFLSNLNIVKTVMIARFKIIFRYKGFLIVDILMPIIFAALPIMLGIAIAGSSTNAEQNFQNNIGTGNYKLYMLIGANVFITVTLMMWLIGFWIRREQETGTLESLYLAPSKKIYVLSGVTIYAILRTLFCFFISFLIGCLIFNLNPLEGNIWIAIVFLFIGMIPLWGISFLFGALIMKIKEADSLISMMQWVLGFFMGVYFPITVFPSFLKFIALSFPPTWMTNGVRASLIDLSYFFGTWYADLAMIFVFAAIVPFLGYTIFLETEQRIKRNEGVGQF